MTPTATATETLKGSKKVFDLDKLERVSVPYEVNFTKISSVQEIPEGVDFVAMYNAWARRKAIADAKAAIPGASPKLVNQFLAGFRILPIFQPKDSNGEVIRTAQTAQIWAFLRTQPQLLDSLKSAAAAAQNAASDENDEDDED